MKIVDIKATPLRLGPQDATVDFAEFMWSCLVEVKTDDGLTGIGEAWAGGSQLGEAAIGIKAFIEKGYSPLLLGEDPTNYRSLWDKIRAYSWYVDTGIGMCALSGVDMALVDLVGKALNVPAYKVLGGCYRTKVRSYASHPSITLKTHEKGCKEVANLIEKGFTAIKVCFDKTFPNFGDNLRRDIKYVKELRDAIGYDVDLMIADFDATRSLSKAISIARKLEDYDLLFWEDPLRRGDIDGYAKLTAAVDLPIEAGEEMTNQMLKNYILCKAVDAINPDVSQIGGLSEMKKIADLAYAVGISVYPHHFSSAISLAANVQLVSSMPDGVLMEHRTSSPDPSLEELLVEPLKFEKGYIEVPKGPGLGIELNKKVLEKITWKG